MALVAQWWRCAWTRVGGETNTLFSLDVKCALLGYCERFTNNYEYTFMRYQPINRKTEDVCVQA